MSVLPKPHGWDGVEVNSPKDQGIIEWGEKNGYWKINEDTFSQK